MSWCLVCQLKDIYDKLKMERQTALYGKVGEINR